MLRRVWKPIAATALLIGAPGYIYYTRKNKPTTFDLSIKVRDDNGKVEMAKRTFQLLSREAVDAHITENASMEIKSRPGGLVWKYSTASLAANDPIEDASSSAIIERDESDPSAPGDLLFFAVMDGHGGPYTSRLLSRILINAVALELSALINAPNPTSSKSIVQSIKSLFQTPSRPTTSHPDNFSQRLQDAFVKLDAELLHAPAQLLALAFDEEARKKNIIPDLSQHPMALATMLPAISGSCALMAVVDTAHRDLYVACTGDSRAVAGIWEEGPDGKGSWHAEVLTEDQTGRNPKELARVRSEHPAEEAPHVIREGRILGGLEPSRAFGDARYKWPREVQEILNQAFMVGNNQPMRQPPHAFKTPPYVTSNPVITHRKLDFLPLGSSKRGATLRFLVLATDGLWDQLSSEDVVSLVAGYQQGLRGIISKSEMPNLVPTSTGSPTVEGKEKRPSQKGESSWAFVDGNVSSHLIRNAFGGGDEGRLRRLLSIPPPFARRYRDDITVTVVWWEDGREENAQVSQSALKDFVKAKL